MPRYNIVESVGKTRQDVRSYDDIERHHPSSGVEKGRHYQTIDGRNEEVLSYKGDLTLSRDGHPFVSKDFILLNSETGGKEGLPVPSPAAGFITLDKANGLVRIYDRMADGELIAQIRHMDLSGFALQDGDRIEYGQPMGIQSGMGGGVKKYATHTHVDFNSNHLAEFKQYIANIETGIISTDAYPVSSKSSSPRDADNICEPGMPRATPYANTLASLTAGHPDYALFQAIRRQLPTEISEEKAAEVMMQAKNNGITAVNKLDKVVVHEGQAWIAGKTIGDLTNVDLSTPAPPLGETLRQSEAFDQQRT